MAELIKRSKKWRYFVNQAGTVMPQIDIREASSKIASLGPRNDSIFSMNVSTQLFLNLLVVIAIRFLDLYRTFYFSTIKPDRNSHLSANFSIAG